MTCDPNELSKVSSRIRSLGDGFLAVVRTSLLCKWVNAITGISVFAFHKNAAPAFGVNFNNTTGKNMLAIIALNISYDHLSPGTYQMQIVTNDMNPAGNFTYLSNDAVNDQAHQTILAIPVGPGGFYRVNNVLDPGAGNSIISIWEVSF